VPVDNSRRGAGTPSGKAAKLEAVEKARRAVELVADKQATDITMLDIRRVSNFADYFVLCTAGTDRQMRAVYESVDESLGHEGVPLIRREGTPESGWVLLDFGDVIVHVFSPDQRDYYRLDTLWKEAVPVVRIQ
jgi:ribosome-associated protein